MYTFAVAATIFRWQVVIRSRDFDPASSRAHGSDARDGAEFRVDTIQRDSSERVRCATPPFAGNDVGSRAAACRIAQTPMSSGINYLTS